MAMVHRGREPSRGRSARGAGGPHPGPGARVLRRGSAGRGAPPPSPPPPARRGPPRCRAAEAEAEAGAGAGAGAGAEDEAEAVWAAFAGAAAGDWVGRAAEFAGASLAPVELPAIYVPEAFREWGETLYDWQTHTATAVDPGPARGLTHTLRKLVPLAACESVRLETLDAETAMLRTDLPANAGEAKTALADGSYSAGTRRLDPAGPAAILETCLALPAGGRVRVRQHVGFSEPAGAWVLRRAEVVVEDRYAPDGAGGAAPPADPLEHAIALDGGGAGSFANKAGLAAAEALAGDWGGFDGRGYVLERDEAASQGGRFRDAAGPGFAAPVGAGAVGLPLGLWSTVRSDAGGLVVEVGRVADDGRARQLAQRRYDADGWLLDVVLGAEVRVA